MEVARPAGWRVSRVDGRLSLAEPIDFDGFIFRYTVFKALRKIGEDPGRIYRQMVGLGRNGGVGAAAVAESAASSARRPGPAFISREFSLRNSGSTFFEASRSTAGRETGQNTGLGWHFLRRFAAPSTSAASQVRAGCSSDPRRATGPRKKWPAFPLPRRYWGGCRRRSFHVPPPPSAPPLAAPPQRQSAARSPIASIGASISPAVRGLNACFVVRRHRRYLRRVAPFRKNGKMQIR